jgi:hypothetical protein
LNRLSVSLDKNDRMHFRIHITRFVAIAAATCSLLSLSACGSTSKADSTEATDPTEATEATGAPSDTETSQSSVVQSETVPVVEVLGDVSSDETVALAPTDGNDVAANPNYPAAAPEVPTQTVESCEPLAKAYNEAATTWLAVKVIAESDLAVRKSFDKESTAKVRDGLATLRTELAADPASLSALTKIERGFAAILSATGSGASESANELRAFMKETPDLASVPKPISTALRAKGCVVVDY